MYDKKEFILNLDFYIENLNKKGFKINSNFLNNLIDLENQVEIEIKEKKSNYLLLLNKTANSSTELKENCVLEKEIKELKILDDKLNSIKKKIQYYLYKIPNISKISNLEDQILFEKNNFQFDYRPYSYFDLNNNLFEIKNNNLLYKEEGFRLLNNLVALIKYFFPASNFIKVSNFLTKEDIFDCGSIENDFYSHTSIKTASNISFYIPPFLSWSLLSYTRNFEIEEDSYNILSYGKIQSLSTLMYNEKYQLSVLSHTSNKNLDFYFNQIEDIFQKLNLPYRKILVSINNLFFLEEEAYLYEVFLYSENKYIPVIRLGNFGNFAIRRFNIKSSNMKKTIVLDFFELDIILFALIERFQTLQKTFKIPF